MTGHDHGTILRMADTAAVLLGPAGTVRDLVAAVLSRHGFSVETDDWAAGGTVVLVAPGPEHWTAARSSGAGVVLVAGQELTEAEELEAVLHGADAVVRTDASPLELARAVDAVSRGETLLSPPQIRRLAAAARAGHLARTQLRLTVREAEILRSVERGESVKQTARSLGIAVKTVENLQSRMFRKLGARNRVHAVTLARRLGLLEGAEAVAS